MGQETTTLTETERATSMVDAVQNICVEHSEGLVTPEEARDKIIDAVVCTLGAGIIWPAQPGQLTSLVGGLRTAIEEFIRAVPTFEEEGMLVERVGRAMADLEYAARGVDAVRGIALEKKE